MIEILGLSGMPCAGKTTLFRAFMENGFWVQQKHKTMVWSEDIVRRVIVLGDYSSGGTFGGTDRLSMAVQPEALKLVKLWAADPSHDGWAVLFEGDRLFNTSFLTSVGALPGVKSKWVLLKAGKEELDRRHRLRNDTQTDVWLAGRRTKLTNIVAAVPGIEKWAHATPEDTAKCVTLLQEFCRPPSPEVAPAAAPAAG